MPRYTELMSGIGGFLQGFTRAAQAGDVAEQDRILRLAQAASQQMQTTAGMYTAGERLKIAQEAAGREKQLFPLQKEELAGRVEAAGVATETKRAEFEQWKTTQVALAGMLPEGMTLDAYLATVEVGEAKEALTKLAERKRLAVPEAEVGVGLAELRPRAAAAELATRTTNALISQGIPEKDAAVASKLLDYKEATVWVRIQADLATAGLAQARAGQLYDAAAAEQRMRTMAIEDGVNIERLKLTQMQINAQHKLPREYYWTQMSMVARAIATMGAKATVAEIMAAPEIKDAPPYVGKMMAGIFGGRTGALSDADKQAAVNGLVKFWNTILQAAQDDWKGYEWPEARPMPPLPGLIEPPEEAGGEARALERTGVGPEREVPTEEAKRRFMQRVR